MQAKCYRHTFYPEHMLAKCNRRTFYPGHKMLVSRDKKEKKRLNRMRPHEGYFPRETAYSRISAPTIKLGDDVAAAAVGDQSAAGPR